MIDHENQVFTAVATALRNEYGTGNIFVTGEYVAQPPKFPAVMIVQMDNSVHQRAIDTSYIEHAVDVMYQVDVYCNLQKGKKQQAKDILAKVDDEMSGMGFIRTYKNPVPNMNDATIYRMTTRYKRLITDEEVNL